LDTFRLPSYIQEILIRIYILGQLGLAIS